MEFFPETMFNLTFFLNLCHNSSVFLTQKNLAGLSNLLLMYPEEHFQGTIFFRKKRKGFVYFFGI